MQFEARIPASGDVMFREHLPSPIVHVSSVDLRDEGRPQVVVCTADGTVRGYSSVDKLSEVLQAKHDESHLEQVLYTACTQRNTQSQLTAGSSSCVCCNFPVHLNDWVAINDVSVSSVLNDACVGMHGSASRGCSYSSVRVHITRTAECPSVNLVSTQGITDPQRDMAP